jgi:AraC-like DNA-binding protein
MIIVPHKCSLYVSGAKHVARTNVHSEYELMFVKSGELTVVEEDTMWSLRAGDALFVWPEARHRIEERSNNASFYYVLFSLEDREHETVGDSLEIPKRVTVRRPERVTELFHRYLGEQGLEDFAVWAGPQLIGLMLCELHRASREEAKGLNAHSDLVDMVQLHISQHFSEALSTSIIAEHVKYNAEYLERKFREATGHSITEAIHMKRIWESCRLLLNEKQNIGEVAYTCGFSDSGYFRRIFKRYMELTPSQYRRLYRPTQLALRNPRNRTATDQPATRRVG